MDIKGIYEKVRFWWLYGRLSKMIVKHIEVANSSEAVKEELEMAENLINRGDYMLECFIGLQYLRPEKGWENLELAKHYVEHSAEKGYGPAQFNLGLMYYTGLTGDHSDPVSGAYWMKKAAENGDKHALDFLKMRDEGFVL